MTPSGEQALHVLRQAQLEADEEQAELRQVLRALREHGPRTLTQLARDTALTEGHLCYLLLTPLASGQVRSWTDLEQGILYGVLGEVA